MQLSGFPWLLIALAGWLCLAPGSLDPAMAAAANDAADDSTASAAAVTGDSATAIFSFIESLYDRQDRKLTDYLAAQLDAFIHTFPASEHVSTAHYLQGRVALEAGDDHRAFAYFMKTLFLFPNTTAHAKAAEGARMVITTNKRFADRRNELLVVINQEEPASTPANMAYAYISFLHDLDLDRLREWSLAEFQEFIASFPGDPRNETVLHWIAESYTTLKDHREAAATYLKFEYMFPTSNLLAAVRIRRAEILSDKLKDPEQAVAALSMVITGDPESDVAGTAYFMRARIKSEKIKDYTGAAEDYRRLVTDQPQHSRASDALLALAEIYHKKLKDYGQAASVYDEVASAYPADPKSITALKEASKIYLDRLNQPISAAARYGRIAELFPDSEQAPEALLEAGKISRNKAKDNELAASYYQRVIDDYPRTDQARKAREELAKL